MPLNCLLPMDSILPFGMCVCVVVCDGGKLPNSLCNVLLTNEKKKWKKLRENSLSNNNRRWSHTSNWLVLFLLLLLLFISFHFSSLLFSISSSITRCCHREYETHTQTRCVVRKNFNINEFHFSIFWNKCSRKKNKKKWLWTTHTRIHLMFEIFEKNVYIVYMDAICKYSDWSDYFDRRYL